MKMVLVSFSLFVVSFSARSILLRCYIPSLLLLFYSPECGDDRFHANRAVRTHGARKCNARVILCKSRMQFYTKNWFELPCHLCILRFGFNCESPAESHAQTHANTFADNSSIENCKSSTLPSTQLIAKFHEWCSVVPAASKLTSSVHTHIPSLMDSAFSRRKRSINTNKNHCDSSIGIGGPHRASNQMPRETKTNVSWRWHALLFEYHLLHLYTNYNFIQFYFVVVATI